ncbi:acetyl-CoA carboxylase biotin carboxylase subunit [Halomonas urumqiensis]|uniref:Biotin carboxylase n=1 Tax=Halomonas urumqiensis TaxID=1684789 RepID=A0A2N7UI83_9GAMM|nr:acetyl-CoA carboxylase biotin carboxylase subunit [Halomonas urumqiensis]PMR80142.1 acetyl-CoA carboxylase biotin carboxylase subunit [Halomonas urumqiensis]PTB01334.1 acetyl-CoA carboxylase biotin carboxylase subunit [Halomonas urumqiensis]
MLNNIKSIMVANRGEISLRIIRACKELGVKSIAIYSEADKDTLPVQMADAAICIGPAPAQLSYQNQEAIISAALAFGVDAIHPGYGFLSEKADFAKKCEDNDIVFIGPSAEIISKMGDKIEARKIADSASVPTIPGSDGAVTEAEKALEIANKIGFPLLIKASAGGGGRGMRVVKSKNTLEQDLTEIMSEAEVAFGDPAVYIEKYLTDIRHVEVQLLADGISCIHLGERDCTAQRRNQKLVEEAPSPILSAAQREDLCQSAVRLAKKVKYKSAGTVEYVFDNVDKKFYFIEMNTRVQVEHPVSEMITGIDIIKEQIKIADDQLLEIKQKDISLHGHAIECRLNAEDPENGFMPCPGTIGNYRPPGGFGIRMDSHLLSGYKIPPYYDSMIGKLICWGADRNEAIVRMTRALSEMKVDGVKTTATFHSELINRKEFKSGYFNTAFVGSLLESKC